ncbi:deoxyribose-phosphate aldolase [Nitrospira sp.]|nr:deoxyribose-phosphate aldolase [Nitrospira sp.]
MMSRKLTTQELAALIDHTVLRADATRADVLRVCEEAKQWGFAVIFIPPSYVVEAVEAVGRSAIRVGIPIGFPLGGHRTSIKVAEALDGVACGARVLDMVINISRLKSGDYDWVRRDMAAVCEATPGAEHKAILETCLLTKEELRIACRLALEAGMDYVKTSTGFSSGGARVEDVRIMKEAVSGQAKVKASGGIRDLPSMLALLDAGADRIGTSAGVDILRGGIGTGLDG